MHKEGARMNYVVTRGLMNGALEIIAYFKSWHDAVSFEEARDHTCSIEVLTDNELQRAINNGGYIEEETE